MSENKMSLAIVKRYPEARQTASEKKIRRSSTLSPSARNRRVYYTLRIWPLFQVLPNARKGARANSAAGNIEVCFKARTEL